MSAGSTSSPFSLAADASFKNKAAGIFGSLSAISVPRSTPSTGGDNTAAGEASDAPPVVVINGLRVGVDDIDLGDIVDDHKEDDEVLLDCELDDSCTTKDAKQSELKFNDMSKMKRGDSLEAKVAAATSRLAKHAGANRSGVAKETAADETNNDQAVVNTVAKSSDRSVTERSSGNGQDAEKPCKNFFTYGDCHFGARCKFSHGSGETEAAKLKSKWTKHSLSDVHISPEETTETAMKFLEDLRRRKEAERLGVSVADLPKEGGANGISVAEAVGDAKLVFKARDKASGGLAKEKSGGPPVKKKVKVSFEDQDETADMPMEPVSAPRKRKPRMSFGDDEGL